MAAPFEQLATNITVGRGLVIHPDDVPASPFDFDLDTRILLGQRLPYPLSHNNPNAWEHLGGKIEPEPPKADKTTYDAARRETDEEGGVPTERLPAPFVSGLTLVERPLEDRGYGPSRGKYRVDIYPLRALGYSLTPFPTEHQALGWFPIQTAIKELRLSRETQLSLLQPRLVGFRVVHLASQHFEAA